MVVIQFLRILQSETVAYANSFCHLRYNLLLSGEVLLEIFFHNHLCFKKKKKIFNNMKDFKIYLIVAGGLLEISYSINSFHSLIILFDTFSKNSQGKWLKVAVIKSVVFRTNYSCVFIGSFVSHYSNRFHRK